MYGDRDTIAAIGTARGTAALSIVRISGEKAPQIVAKCFSSKNADLTQSHRAFFGLWTNPETNNPIDEVVVLNFTNGHGYTGEAAVDIICHGGVYVTDAILESTLNSGARLARPGEFTYRAFMNNRLDLSQAENVLGLIEAKSPKAATLALKNVRGKLSETLLKIESDITFILAQLEAAIDFTTEDIQPVSYKEMTAKAENVLEHTKKLSDTYIAGQSIRQGLRVAISGRPNGGKSSLLNSLLGKERSIVSDEAGTTRDTIEADIIINGQQFILIDTAGVRESDHAVERRGIEKALEEGSGSDLVLYVVDSNVGLSNEDVNTIKLIGQSKTIICFNKADQKKIDISRELQRYGLIDVPALQCSALESDGQLAIREMLSSKCKNATYSEIEGLISTSRQKEGLLKTIESLNDAIALLVAKASPELVTVELGEALRQIKNLLGKEAADDVLDRVFKEFCIGK